MTVAALQGLHVVVSLSSVARRSTCFFATISETSDEDKNPIWLCPYWATASLLTMLSVAHIFSCLHNQCSRSVDHFPSFCLANDSYSPAGSSCRCQLVFCSKEEHLFLRYNLWNVRWRQKSNLTLPLLSYSKPVDNVECCAYFFLSAQRLCSRSVDHFPSFCLANDTCSPAGPSCCCQLVLCSKEEHLFLRYDLWNVRWRQKSNLTLPLLSYSKPVDNVECCAYLFLSAQPVQ